MIFSLFVSIHRIVIPNNFPQLSSVLWALFIATTQTDIEYHFILLSQLYKLFLVMSIK